MDRNSQSLIPTVAHKNSLALLIIIVMVALTVLILLTKHYLLAFVPCLAISCYLIMSKYPQFGIYLFIFLIPFGAFRKFDMLGLSINVSWLIAAPLLFIVLLQKIVTKSSFASLKLSLWPWFGLFFLIEIISTWLSPYPSSAINETKLWLASFLFIALMAMLISRHDFYHTIPSILIGSVFFSSLLGNLGFFFDITIFTGAQFNATFARNLGGAIDANNLSLMVIACLPLIVYRYFYSSMRWGKLFYAIILANSILAIGTTYSRGGMLIFIIATFLILWQYRHYIKVKYLGFILLGLSIGISAFVAVMPQSFWQRQLSLASAQDTSLNRRAAYVGVAMQAFIENPVFGTGPDSFYQIFALTPMARISEDSGQPLGRYAHNTYLEILVGMGLSGLVIFVIILAKALWSFTRVRKKYLMAGKTQQAQFIASYRLFLFLVLLYLMIFSETHHKFMLVGLVLSQLAERFYHQELQQS